MSNLIVSNFWMVFVLISGVLLALYWHGLRTMRRDTGWQKPQPPLNKAAGRTSQFVGNRADAAPGTTLARQREAETRSDPMGLDTSSNYGLYDSNWGGSSSDSCSGDSSSSVSSSPCGD